MKLLSDLIPNVSPGTIRMMLFLTITFIQSTSRLEVLVSLIEILYTIESYSMLYTMESYSVPIVDKKHRSELLAISK